jgi:uncharacterized protein (TIGR03067 family)
MLVTKIKNVLAVMLVGGLTLGGIGAGAGLSTNRQPAQKEKQPAKTDEERMIGSWTIVNDDSKRKGEVWEIGNHQIVSHALVKVVKGTKAHSYFHRLDAGKNPKHIDITLTEVGSSVIGPDVPIDGNAQTVGVIKGIYSLEGDELRFCLAPIDKDRPAKFPEKPKPGEVLILQRQTPGVEQPKAKEKLLAAKYKLWAGLAFTSSTSPTVRADVVKDGRFFMIYFELINDGESNFAPTEEVNDSKLFINGKELKDWPHIIHNGPREAPGTELKTGESLRFGKSIGKHCTEPGIYRVQWKGKSFESAVLEFRVLPARKATERGAGVKDKLSKATLELREVEASFAEARKKHLAAKVRLDQLVEKAKANENKHTGKDDNKAFLEALELNLAKAQLKQTEASLEVERLKCIGVRLRLEEVELEGREGKPAEKGTPGSATPTEKTSAVGPKFDAVILVKGNEPDPSLLYVVLTQPKADLDKLCELVVKHAEAAIQAATEHKFQGTTKANERPKHQGNIVFLVRVSTKALDGHATGFTVEQLREIATASPEDGKRLVRRHAWALSEKIPAQK